MQRAPQAHERPPSSSTPGLGDIKNDNLDERLKKPVKLSKDERENLLAFIKALEVKADRFERPKLPE